MKTSQLLPALAALSFGLMGIVSPAIAAPGFSVIVDCHGDGGLPDWSHTGSTVTIKAYVNDFALTIWDESVPSSKCNAEDEVVASYPAFSASDVQKIVISISGSDAFWMDLVKLKDTESGTIHEQWGTDNNFGYCLSTDSKDAGPYCHDGKAVASRTFQ